MIIYPCEAFNYVAIIGHKLDGVRSIWAPFYYRVLTLIPAWISNYIHYNVWDEITYQFLNFNGATVEV